MKTIALFAGAGGFSEGFKKAGFDIVCANEIDKSAMKTYKKRHGIEDNRAFCKDIKDLKVKEITSLCDKIDVVIGGPPCQGFSMAGARIRGNKFVDDPRNYLFKEYFRILKNIRPKYFVMENVPALASFAEGRILSEIVDLFSQIGYNIDKKIVNAANYGVPQSRKRIFIIGSKNNTISLDKMLGKYKKTKVTVKEAISDLNYLESGEGQKVQDYITIPKYQYQIERRKNSLNLYNHKATNHSKETINKIKKIKNGENWEKLEELNYKINSKHSGAYGRLKWNAPSVTLTTRFDTPSGGRFIHPERDRTITLREAARLQSFDDDYIFYGNKSSIKKQIGNAVPPLLAEIIATIILDKENKKQRG